METTALIVQIAVAVLVATLFIGGLLAVAAQKRTAARVLFLFSVSLLIAYYLLGLGLSYYRGPLPQTSCHLSENKQFDLFIRMLIRQTPKGNLNIVSGDRQYKRFEKEGLRLLWNLGKQR